MKQTILNQSQLNTLENALLHFGNVVSVDELATLLPSKSPEYRRTYVKGLADAGWLVRVKRGTYQIAEMSSLGTLSLSRFVVAQIILPDSYVSFESALQHWGMYDQMLGVVTSVALQQYPSTEVEGTRYRYVKTSQAYFYGWQVEEINQHQVRIALPEKALLDMVQFHRSRLSLSLVREKLAAYYHQLDFERLEELLLRANLTTLRIWGHLLDQLGLDTAQLWARSSESTSVSKVTRHSQVYDAKWRLYYNQNKSTFDPILPKD